MGKYGKRYTKEQKEEAVRLVLESGQSVPQVASHLGMAETTLATHLRHIRAALSWAVSVGMMARVPEIKMPKRAQGKTFMRGRPITGEEFDRMLLAVPKVRPNDAHVWEEYLRGLWLSGLRLEESTVLSWDDDSPFAVDLSGRHPRFRIYAEAEKGHRNRLLGHGTGCDRDDRIAPVTRRPRPPAGA